MKGRVCALVGAQYGSEGKGAVAAAMANDYQVHVRSGGPNAGHTYYHQYGPDPFVSQQLPCGWTNPNARMVIAAGAIVDPVQLCQEVARAMQFDPTVPDRLFIDLRAYPLIEADSIAEGGAGPETGGELWRRIGSTGKGVGMARRRRIARSGDRAVYHSFCNMLDAPMFGGTSVAAMLAMCCCDTVPNLHAWRNAGQNILLEGCQGSGLSLWHGPWPFATSHDTNAAQLCADAGLPPQWVNEVVLVARTFPIRVAGNSGPLKGEMTWDELCRRQGLDIDPEYTTVTKLKRRIGEWDDALFRRAVRLNDPTKVALTFADYIDPSVYGVNEWGKLTDKVVDFITAVQLEHNVNITYVGTGPQTYCLSPRPY